MFSFEHLKYPLIQAPMAGGPNTPQMVSTVINNGAVGSFGFAYSSAEKIEADIQATRDQINDGAAGAMNINFFVFSPVDEPSPQLISSASQALDKIAGEALISTNPKAPYYPDLKNQLEPVWNLRPEILTFHFGIPDPEIINKAHRLGIAVGITATCADEARQIEEAGADFIVAQGIEAGGHRGIFNPDNDDEALPCFALITRLKQVTRLPLAAAGGIMTHQHIDTAIQLGAAVVQMGTAFLTTTESGASPAHKTYLLNETGREAVITRGFSGRPARGIDNQFIQQISGAPLLPFPLQNTLTAKIRANASAQNNGELQSLWAGSHFNLCRSEDVTGLLQRLFD